MDRQNRMLSKPNKINKAIMSQKENKDYVKQTGSEDRKRETHTQTFNRLTRKEREKCRHLIVVF